MNALALANAKGRSQAALSDSGERGLGPSPKEGGRAKLITSRTESPVLRPAHPDSTANRLALATSALERIHLAAKFESYPLIERIAADALANLTEEPTNA